MKTTGYTKDGPVEIEIETREEKYKEELSKAVSLQQELDIIKKFLGLI